MISNYFYNKNLSVETNSMLWWTWESVIHHFYFIVLFVQRQFSDKWHRKGELYKVNMEKECEFFELLFGGNAQFCAEATSSLFAGLWFRNPSPGPDHLDWISRLITNYQHTEAVVHFSICILGLAIIMYLGSVGKPIKTDGANVPAALRWGFFVAIAFETYTMCVPYLFLFSWVWTPFIEQPKGGLVTYIESVNTGDKFLEGIQFGAALITMFWVSVVVLILDGWATVKAWNFARDGKTNRVLSWSLVGALGALIVGLVSEFFSERGRAGTADGEISYTEIVCDLLHHVVGGDYTPMRKLMPKAV